MTDQEGASVAFSYAPGKVILAGEHAVVYGCPAIATTLDRGVRIAVHARPQAQVNGDGPMLKATGLGFVGQVCAGPNGQGPAILRLALERLVTLCGERVRGLELVVDSSIPGGRGLGSSAALSVAMVRAVYRYFEEALSEEQTLRIVTELERIFHGNPSGIDHAVVTHGGVLWFERAGEEPRMERLVLKRPLCFAVGLSHPHGGTARAVEALRERSRRHEEAYTHLFSGIRRLVHEMRDALAEGHLAAAGELMNVNQGYLNALGVSTPELESLCALARQLGALGAKLTGAGGGGAVIALVDGDPEPIVKAFLGQGCLAFSSGTKGLDDQEPN